MRRKSEIQKAFFFLYNLTGRNTGEGASGFIGRHAKVAGLIARCMSLWGECEDYVAYRLMTLNPDLLMQWGFDHTNWKNSQNHDFELLPNRRQVNIIPDSQKFRITFKYDAALVRAVKQIPGAWYDASSKSWEVSHKSDSFDNLVNFISLHNFEVSPDAYELLISEPGQIEMQESSEPSEKMIVRHVGRQIYRDKEKWRLAFAFDKEIINAIKSLRSVSVYDPETRTWLCSASEHLLALCGKYDFEGRELLDETLHFAERKLREEIENLSSPLPGPRGIILRTHQREAIIKCLERGRMILAHDMGTGKTLTSLVAAKAIREVYGANIIVLGPVSLRENWNREAQEAGVSIEYHSWAKVPTSPVNGRPYILICDEAHAMQSLKAKRTQATLKLADKAFYAFFLTGTPIKNGRPANLYPLLKACKHELSENRSWYEEHFCDAHETEWTSWDVTGASNLDELHNKTRDVILRKTKRECLDLPPLTRVYKEAEVSTDARIEYERLLQELWDYYLDRVISGDISPNDALVALTHLRMAGSYAKKDSAIELASEVIEQGGQVIISTQFIDPAYDIGAELLCEVITGETPANKRQSIVDRFQEGKRRALVITGGAGGVGLNLYAADTVILVDRPWTPGDAEQIEGRAHRSGVNHPVTSIWLRYGEIDKKVDKLLEDKSLAVSQVLDGKVKQLQVMSSAVIAFRVLNDMVKERKIT